MQLIANTAAVPRVVGSTITFGSMISPTDTRNIGMNSADPKNSMCSKSGPAFGISGLRASPAKKAPTMPSMPNASQTTTAENSAARAMM